MAAHFLPNGKYPYRARRHAVALSDGDQIVLHEDCPSAWSTGDLTALLVHGLAGCHASPYMERIAARLTARGVRAYRMDMRGCGAGAGLAHYPTHAGRSGDVSAALRYIAKACPGAPTALVGFSLGGNISLNVSAEASQSSVGNLARAMAVCPPVDLAACSRSLQHGLARCYDRYFTRLLVRQLQTMGQTSRAVRRLRVESTPVNLWEFDDRVTAPLAGFNSAAEYYTQTSSGTKLVHIAIPTLIIAARDDPLVPYETVSQSATSAAVRIHISESGGHLGFLGRKNHDPDRRWIDWRVIDWVCCG